MYKVSPGSFEQWGQTGEYKSRESIRGVAAVAPTILIFHFRRQAKSSRKKEEEAKCRELEGLLDLLPIFTSGTAHRFTERSRSQPTRKLGKRKTENGKRKTADIKNTRSWVQRAEES